MSSPSSLVVICVSTLLALLSISKVAVGAALPTVGPTDVSGYVDVFIGTTNDGHVFPGGWWNWTCELRVEHIQVLPYPMAWSKLVWTLIRLET